MASFQYKDICYPSEVEALQSFISQYEFHYVDVAGEPITYSLASAVIDIDGHITYTLRNSDTGAISGNKDFFLQSCDSLSSSAIFDKVPVQDMIFAAAFVLVFVLGIFQGHKS